MATYHLSLKNGKTGTAKQHADYILREGRYSGGKRAEEMVYKDANLPHWAMSVSAFFANADKYERTNGRAYSEFEIALPNELTHEENQKLVKDFIVTHIGNNKVWAYAIHSKPATFDDKEEQIHAHIMFCERNVEDGMGKAKLPSKFFKRFNSKNPEKGGYKKDERFTSSDARDIIKKIRQSWEDMVNGEYKSRGIDKVVSCKTLAAQRDLAVAAGDNDMADFFNRTPQEHLGPALAYKTKKIIEENGYDQENIDNTLDKIYQMSAKAFGVIIDKIQKARKATELKLKKQIDLERKEKEYAEKRLAELTISGEVIRKDFGRLLNSVNNQITYNESAIIAIDRTIMTPEEISYKAASTVSGGKIERLKDAEDVVYDLQKELREIKSKYGSMDNMPEATLKQYKDKGRYYKALKSECIAEWEKINNYLKSDLGNKWYVRLINEMTKQNDDMLTHKKELLKINEEYQELRSKVIEVGRNINPNLIYRMKTKYCAPSLGSGASAITDANRDIDKLLRNIISAGRENIKRNKMTVNLSNRKSSGWEI